MLFDNDTRILFTIVFDGDFKPYIKDILKEAGPWLDRIFVGVWDGFKGSNDAESVERLLSSAVEAELFFVAIRSSRSGTSRRCIGLALQ